MFFDETLILRGVGGFGLKGFKAIDRWWVFGEPELSIFDIFVVASDWLLLFFLFFLLLDFFFFFGPFALLDLLIKNAFHLPTFFLQFWDISVKKLFGEGPSNMALLLKLLGFIGIIHLRSLNVQKESKTIKIGWRKTDYY